VINFCKYILVSEWALYVIIIFNTGESLYANAFYSTIACEEGNNEKQSPNLENF
jgi:hypothetical protein